MKTILQNGFTKDGTYRILSVRPEYHTQHIAYIYRNVPICGSKITDANEVPLLLGYLCDRCKRVYETTEHIRKEPNT